MCANLTWTGCVVSHSWAPCVLLSRLVFQLCVIVQLSHTMSSYVSLSNWVIQCLAVCHCLMESECMYSISHCLSWSHPLSSSAAALCYTCTCTWCLSLWLCLNSPVWWRPIVIHVHVSPLQLQSWHSESGTSLSTSPRTERYYFQNIYVHCRYVRTCMYSNPPLERESPLITDHPSLPLYLTYHIIHVFQGPSPYDGSPLLKTTFNL